MSCRSCLVRGRKMSDKNSARHGNGIERRTVLRNVGVASGAGLFGTSVFSGSVAARGSNQGGGGPCHREFDSECNGDHYVKIEFVIEVDEETGEIECFFEEETDTGLVEITEWEGKDGEECEPIAVEWESDGYVATKVMAFGGTDCVTVDEPDGQFDERLENPAGRQAAISNLQFCLAEEDETLATCPIYGTSREDPTAIFGIKADADTGEIVEVEVGDIPDDSTDSNYPNGVAFDDENDVWYFAEDTGELKTMNEDGNLGIEEYGVVTPGGEPIAGAAFWDETGEYLYIPNGTNLLMAADIGGGTAETRTVTTLNWSNIGLGDLAIDRDANVLYVSTTRPMNFFRVDLDDYSDQVEIASDSDRETYAVGMQIAFDDQDTLWAHNAGTGEWFTVDLSDGSLSDLVETTKEYTDLARCGFADVGIPEIAPP